MANLLKEASPFSNMGVGFFRQLEIKHGRSLVKQYSVIFSSHTKSGAHWDCLWSRLRILNIIFNFMLSPFLKERFKSFFAKSAFFPHHQKNNFWQKKKKKYLRHYFRKVTICRSSITVHLNCRTVCSTFQLLSFAHTISVESIQHTHLLWV